MHAVAALAMSSMSNDDEKDNEVYRVETVPPPPGEDNAYDAPTKVGATAQAVLAAMRQAAADGSPLKPMTLPTSGTAEIFETLEPEEAGPDDAPVESDVIPKIHHEEDEEGFVFAKTALMDSALRPQPVPRDVQVQSTPIQPVARIGAGTNPIPYPQNFVGQRPNEVPSFSATRVWTLLSVLMILAAIMSATIFYLRHW